MNYAEGAFPYAGETDDQDLDDEYVPEVTIDVVATDEPRLTADNVDQSDENRVQHLQNVIDAIYDGDDIPANGVPDSLYYNAPKQGEAVDLARKANVEAARAMLGQALGFESDDRASAAVSEADVAMRSFGTGGDDFVKARLSEQRRAGNSRT